MKLKLWHFKCQKWRKKLNPISQAYLNTMLRFFQFSEWKHLWVNPCLNQYAEINFVLSKVISVMKFDGMWTTMSRRIWRIKTVSSVLSFLLKFICQDSLILSESYVFSSVQLLSCVQLCDPMDCSTPGFHIHHQLQELTQTHAHQVSDAIQPSHSLLPASPPAFNLSQHQGLFR